MKDKKIVGVIYDPNEDTIEFNIDDDTSNAELYAILQLAYGQIEAVLYGADETEDADPED